MQRPEHPRRLSAVGDPVPDDRPSNGRVAGRLTDCEVRAAVRDRLAAQGFDWGDALSTGRAAPAEETRPKRPPPSDP